VPVKKYLAVIALLSVAACGDSSKPSSSKTPPVRVACTTPEQAGNKAADITRKLVEAKKQGTITQDQYIAFNNQMSSGFRAWAERQDLKTYCATLDRIVKDAALN
jgi:hypothetical protein